MNVFNDPLYKTRLTKDEATIATIKMRKTRILGLCIICLLILSAFVSYLLSLDYDANPSMFYLFLIVSILVFLGSSFFIIENICRTLKTEYILTNKRIIIKEFILFRYYGNSFNYGVVEDILIRKNEILNTYDIHFIFDVAAVSTRIDNRNADHAPKFVSISKTDIDMVVKILNKYCIKKNKNSK